MVRRIATPFARAEPPLLVPSAACGWRVVSLLSLAALGACGGNAEEWPFAVGRSAGIAVVTDTAKAEGRLRNATLDYGAFFVRNQCLQVRVGGADFTPVLPGGVEMGSDGTSFTVGGKRLQTGRRYTLPFANQVGLRPGEAAASIGLPNDCAQRLMRMGLPS